MLPATVFFDLDGTLTDPGTGITRSVMHALRGFGIEPPPARELYSFIGPPLRESFRNYFGITDGDRAIALYREYYAQQGIFENEVYPGIPALLAHLRDAGRTLVLATSKPEEYARQILSHFGLLEFFTFVGGATFDERRVEKADVLAYAVQAVSADPALSVMVGDREHDVRGGRAAGIPAVGVLWGYGSEEELRAAGARAVVRDVPALQSLLDTGLPDTPDSRR